MEVHHSHNSAKKKKWSELLLEFFMLFLAITLGFFAENLRESMADNQKRKELLESVAKDFKKDIHQSNSHIQYNEYRRTIIDSLDQLLKLPQDQIEQRKFYRLLFEFPHMWRFTSNNKSRTEAEAKGYFSSDDKEDLAEYIFKYEYFLSELDAFFTTEMNTLSTYIDTKLVKFVNPDLYRPGVSIPNKMGIERIDPSDVKYLRVLLVTKFDVINYEKQLYDSLNFYAKKSIDEIEKDIKK